MIERHSKERVPETDSLPGETPRAGLGLVSWAVGGAVGLAAVAAAAQLIVAVWQPLV